MYPMKQPEDCPSMDPGYEPKQKVVTLTVLVTVSDQGDDKDTMAEAKAELASIIDHGSRNRHVPDVEVDEAIEITDA